VFLRDLRVAYQRPVGCDGPPRPWTRRLDVHQRPRVRSVSGDGEE